MILKGPECGTIGGMSTPAIAIVGMGPRGISILERLSARMDDSSDPITVHLIDDAQHGAGRNWETDQTKTLCMNTRAGAGVHAQGFGLVRFPVAAGAMLGVIDEVDGNGVAGIVHAGGEAFQDGNAARAHADDRDCWSRHTSYRATFRPFQDHRTWQLE